MQTLSYADILASLLRDPAPLADLVERLILADLAEDAGQAEDAVRLRGYGCVFEGPRWKHRGGLRQVYLFCGEEYTEGERVTVWIHALGWRDAFVCADPSPVVGTLSVRREATGASYADRLNLDPEIVRVEKVSCRAPLGGHPLGPTVDQLR